MDGKRYPLDSLTAREVQILQLVALGLSNRDIAEELIIAPETVRWYTKQIYSKLGVSGRIQAINRARELDLLQDRLPEQTGTTEASFTQAVLSNLPAAVTPFIGRIREIAAVKRLLEGSRLLTLTGVGGSGKTRLALRLAAEVMNDFPDGVFFVDLAPLSDYRQVTKTIAGVLNVIESPAEPMLHSLERALVGRRLLLVIDNFEHVVDAAPLVSELLAASPNLKALITSREALRLSGEQEYVVPPLSLPASDTPGDLIESEAGTLFMRRAQMVLPRLEVTADNAPVIAQICARLDGLPLAIELAAARCKLFTPQALLARLSSRLSTLTGGTRDAPLRQQTLRATLDWSYNLLDTGEKTLFARLSVFRGGCSMEAVQAVCGPDLPTGVLDGLVALVDKNLIQQQEAPGGERRFVMLETIHEYGREHLAESSEADTVHRRYAAYYVELAERAEPEFRLAQQDHWFQCLEQERTNLRAVLEWSLHDGDITLGVRLAGALFMFWHFFASHVEGYEWTQQLLLRLGETPDTYHAKFLICAGYMAWLQDEEQAKALFAKALHVARTLGDQFHTAWALAYSASLLPEESRFATLENALSLFRELDHKPGIALTLNVIGDQARAAGASDHAKRAFQECLSVVNQTGDTRLLYAVFHNRSVVAQHEGDYETAIDLLRRSIGYGRAIKNLRHIAEDMQFLAGSFRAAGEPERAARLLGWAEVTLERLGAFLEPHDKLEVDRTIAAVREQLDEMTFAAAWAEGRLMTLEQALAMALGDLA